MVGVLFYKLDITSSVSSIPLNKEYGTYAYKESPLSLVFSTQSSLGCSGCNFYSQIKSIPTQISFPYIWHNHPTKC